MAGAATSSTISDQILGHELFKDRFWGGLIAAIAKPAASASSDRYEYEDNVRAGIEVIDTAVRAVNPRWWDREDGAVPLRWHHHLRLSLSGKVLGEPHIDRMTVEEATADYLALPFRVEQWDRLLIDMLMASEIFSFADEVQPQLNQRLPTLLGWAWGLIKTVALGVIVPGVLLWLFPQSAAAFWISAVVVILALASVAISVIILPFAYPTVRAQRLKLTELVRGMKDAYTALGGSPASIPHIRRLVDRANDAGVVWPAPLMALLDDVAERRKSI